MARRITLDNGKSILAEQCFDKIKTRGRPRLKLNEMGLEIISKLAGMRCSEEEMASFLETTVETLHNKENKVAFLECKKNGEQLGKVGLRQNLFRLSRTNPAVCIFLAKNILGMQDNPPPPIDEEEKIIFVNDIPEVKDE